MPRSGSVGLLIAAAVTAAQTTTALQYVAYQAQTAGTPLPTCAQDLPVHRNEILDTFRLILVAVPDRSQDTGQVDACLDGGWQRVPVRTTSSVLQIPTGEIMMKVKPGTADTILNESLEDLGLRIVTPRRENRAFKVSTVPLSAARSEHAVTRLRDLPFVEYAEPNWLMIRRSEPIRR